LAAPADGRARGAAWHGVILCPHHTRITEDDINDSLCAAFATDLDMLHDINVPNDLVLQHGFQVLRVQAHVGRTDEIVFERVVQVKVGNIFLFEAEGFVEPLTDVNVHRQRRRGRGVIL